MRNKRIKTVAMCALASLLIQQTCFCAPRLSYDYDNGIVTVSGHEDNKKRVSVQVVNPGVDLTSGDAGAYDGYFAYVGYADCDENGDYVLNIKLDGADMDETVYKLRINGEQYENDFAFTKKSKVDEVLGVVNGATDASTLAENLKEYSRLMGCRTYVLFDNITDIDKLRLAQKIIDGTDVNCAQFTDTVNGAVIPAALCNASSESAFASILGTYEDLIPIDYEITYYKSLGSAQAQKVISRMYAEKSRAVNMDAVKRLYEEAVTLEAIGSVGQKSQVGDIIDYFSHLFTHYAEYQALGENKVMVWENAIDADKSTFDVFEALFNTWVANGGVTPDPTHNPGGGGGGGSWSGTGTGSSKGGIFAAPEIKQTFNDIAAVAWASESIEALYELKIISGTGEGMFSPQRPVKREEFVRMISLALGLDESATDNKFTDAEPGAWYTSCINAAADAGIINGIGENVFGIGMNISRQDMAVIAQRCLEYAQIVPVIDKSAEFADEENISDYARSAVASLTSAGILSGFEDNTFRPQESVSRAQAAVVVHRLILLMEGKRL